ncbi:L,D-transpeptidase [Camelliibacillus cellulosilyticus]|uniref:L,D-transpeptidase n=1 Tax=Camelliibacillus cellulosilyticus TaxID=2174486 RepID=A0ABV9GI00_9BACL
MSRLLVTMLLSLIIGLSPFWPIGPNPSPGDPFIIVNKLTNRLTFINENQMIMDVPVATGKSNHLTPEGLFIVVVKAKEPYYRKLNIPGGDPRNPLGSRWIGFNADGTDGRTYGVHGTNQPASIGRYITAGCIRMNKVDLEKLYDQVPLGTKILIVRSAQTAKELAIANGALSKRD